MTSQAPQTTNNITPGEQLLVAQEIARQLGKQALFMLGAYDIYSDNGALLFKIKGSRKFRSIRIEVMAGCDVYEVTFTNFRKDEITAVEKVSGLYADMLLSTIEKQTGLYTKI